MIKRRGKPGKGLKIPFENGDMLNYIPYPAGSEQWLNFKNDWYYNQHPERERPIREWRDNLPFKATLQLLRVEGRTHQNVTYWWGDPQGHLYPMFQSTFFETVRNAAFLEYGRTFATWTVRKQGANYGIELVPDED